MSDQLATVSRSVAADDPTVPHWYSGNASGDTCWVGERHAAGMCGQAGEARIHDPFGESWGFVAGGYEHWFAAPDELRCPEVESGGVQCIHLAHTDHAHEVDQRHLGGDPKVVVRRRAAGGFEAVR